MLRIGFSKDIHPLAEGRPFILGGIKLDHPKGPVGHSDADCLLHAIAESILGAMALGDLGNFSQIQILSIKIMILRSSYKRFIITLTVKAMSLKILTVWFR